MQVQLSRPSAFGHVYNVGGSTFIPAYSIACPRGSAPYERNIKKYGNVTKVFIFYIRSTIFK